MTTEQGSSGQSAEVPITSSREEGRPIERPMAAPQSMVFDKRYGHVEVTREGREPHRAALDMYEVFMLDVLATQPGEPVSADTFRDRIKERGVDLRSASKSFSGLRNKLEGMKFFSVITFTRDNRDRRDAITLMMDEVVIRDREAEDKRYVAPWMPEPSGQPLPVDASTINYLNTGIFPTESTAQAESEERRKLTEADYEALPPLIIDPDTNNLTVGGDIFKGINVAKPTLAMLELLDRQRHTQVPAAVLRLEMQKAGSMSGYVGPALYKGVIFPLERYGLPGRDYFEFEKTKNNIVGVTFHGKLERINTVSSGVAAAGDVFNGSRDPSDSIKQDAEKAAGSPEAEMGEPSATGTEIQWKQTTSGEHDPSLPTLVVHRFADKTTIEMEIDGENRRTEYAQSRERILVDNILRQPQTELARKDVLHGIDNNKHPGNISTVQTVQKLSKRLGADTNDLFTLVGKKSTSRITLNANVVTFEASDYVDPGGGAVAQGVRNIAADSATSDQPDKKGGAEALPRGPYFPVIIDGNTEMRKFTTERTDDNTRILSDQVVATLVDTFTENPDSEPWSDQDRTDIKTFLNFLPEREGEVMSLSALKEVIWGGQETPMTDADISVLHVAARAEFVTRTGGSLLQVKPAYSGDKVIGFALGLPKEPQKPSVVTPSDTNKAEQLPTRGRPMTNWEILAREEEETQNARAQQKEKLKPAFAERDLDEGVVVDLDEF